MRRLKYAFSLFELAVTLLIMGLIGVIAARTLPVLNMQQKAIKMGNELREYLVSVLGSAEAERALVKPDNFTSFPQYSRYADSEGNRWGYLAANDLTDRESSCRIDPAQKIAIVYCKGTLAACNSVSQIKSMVQDVGMLMFSSDMTFRSRLGFFAGFPKTNYDGSLNLASLMSMKTPLNPSNYQYYQWILVKVAAPPTMDAADTTLIDFTYQEIWEDLDCPKPRSVTDGMVLSVRPASWGGVDQHYDFVPIPVNFLNISGAEYCFESNLNRTSDLGIAKTYERDNRFVTDTIALPPGNPRGANFCNNLANRVPIYRCDIPSVNNWLGINRYTFDTWNKDSNTAENKWFFCGGDRMWDARNSLATEWYEIRINPGRVDTSNADIYKYERYRNNNRTFTAYGRIPGSRALFKQSFTMNVRGGMTYYWEFDR
ncbi:MAG: hypothetical protein LBD73_08300 [Deferribacteraceae bacterium]|jgi:hypothetical protein|nr:hypothetical protein [Deferribacteraceae bacterium]